MAIAIVNFNKLTSYMNIISYSHIYLGISDEKHACMVLTNIASYSDLCKIQQYMNIIITMQQVND